MMYLHLPILTLVLRKFAKSKIQSYCQEVKASRDWLQKFSQSNELALQKSTLISQKVPEHLEEKLPGFYMMCANFLKTGKYPLALVRNMHETSIFFNMVPNKSFAKKGCKLVTVRTSGCETKHVTVVLTIHPCGDILPPMVIFCCKNDRTIRDAAVPDSLCIVVQEKAWVMVRYEKNMAEIRTRKK